jgi:hypothetical protein
MFLKNTFFILVISLSLFSCKKAVKKDNLLQGTWDLKKVTLFDYDGLSYSTDTSCTGNLIVDRDVDTSFKFNLNYSILPVFADSTVASGKYLLKDDAEYFTHDFLTVTNPNPIPGSHSRILFLSNDYFKWEYITSAGIRYHLIFEKK